MKCVLGSFMAINRLYQENSLTKLLHVFLNFEMLLCLVLFVLKEFDYAHLDILTAP